MRRKRNLTCCAQKVQLGDLRILAAALKKSPSCCEKSLQLLQKILAASAKNGVMHSHRRAAELVTPLLSSESSCNNIFKLS